MNMTMIIYFLQLAQTDFAKCTVGADGKLYKLLDDRDAARFHILSDYEVEHEKTQFRDRARASEKATSTRKGKSIMIGSRSRSTKIQMNTLRKLTAGKAVSGTTLPAQAMLDTLGSLDARTKTAAVPVEQPKSDDIDKVLTGEAGKLIKEKFAENLHAIDALYREKEELRKRLEQYEGSSKSVNCTDMPNAAERIAQSDPKLFTSEAAAEMFSDAEPEIEQPRGRTGWHSSAEAGGARALRSNSANARLYSTVPTKESSQRLRSSSASRGGFTIQMQASIDSYIQRKKIFEQRAKQEKLAQLEYENMLRDRSLRVRADFDYVIMLITLNMIV